MRGVEDLSANGRRVLVRATCNVPLSADGSVADDFRLRAALPTLQLLSSEGAKVLVCGHLGRPGGREAEELSLDVVADRLSELLEKPVGFSADSVGPKASLASSELKEGEVLVLENLRFHAGERGNSPEFASALASLADAYVNDAFAASHRPHASIVGVPRLLPSYQGLLFEKELAALARLLESPERPMVAVVGGAKVATKAALVSEIAKVADTVLVGNLIARQGGVKPEPDRVVVPVDGVPGEGRELDIGPKTLELFSSYLAGAKTVFWSGPLGKVEDERYRRGTEELARQIASSDAFSVAGGGDLNDFLGDIGLRDKFSHASTGGGAMMAYIGSGTLPGIEALNHGG